MNVTSLRVPSVLEETELEHPVAVRLAIGRVELLIQRALAWRGHVEEAMGVPAADSLASVGGLRDLERRWAVEDAGAQILTRQLKELSADLGAERDSALERLCSAFELSAAERDVLHVCLAFAVEPRLLTSAQSLFPNRANPVPNETFVARLCCKPLPLLASNGALLRWHIVRAAGGDTNQPLTLDPHILHFVCDRSLPDPIVEPHAVPLEPKQAPEGWPLAQIAQCIQRATARGTRVRVVVRGARGSGRSTLAACVARLLGSPTLCIDTSRIPDGDWPTVRLHAERQARLAGQNIVWRGTHVGRPAPLPPLGAVEFVVAEPELELAPNPYGIDENFVVPNLTVDERRVLWTQLLPASQSWPQAELEQLSERYCVQVGDIATIALRGVTSPTEASERCRDATRDRLRELGQLLTCPFTRDDLALLPNLNATINQFLFEARVRVRFWEQPAAQRLFPRGRGLIGLMAGPPGTGKTMAAQVIAAELGLDLFRVDLASTINKYIGETAKNLRRIFERAREMNAVILFDEADAMFSKRTEVRDAHDRHANTDTNYLLQLLEEFEGIALLASNKRNNIDSAFVRRIRFVLSFRCPDTAERLLIWRRLVAELEGEEAALRLKPQLLAAAEGVELSGAQIKLSVLAAIFSARQSAEPLKGQHLSLGIQRELSKTGINLDLGARGKIERA